MNTLHPRNGGAFVLLMLVFSGIFLLLVSALGSLIVVQQKLTLAKQNKDQAFHIAESGLEYYKWFLAHNPDDFTNGTGQPGPYVADVSDPEGGVIGSYSLSVTGNLQCGDTQSVTIESTGQTAVSPSLKSTIKARYARPSVAEYAYILNSSDWIDLNRVIDGRYHSNGGIHMDGTINADMTSSVETWLCTSAFGCQGNGETKPGIWGDGLNSNLWKFPVPQMDFAGIAADLVTMKSNAQFSGGTYIGPSLDDGYHVIFKSDGTYDLYKVTATTDIKQNNGNNAEDEESVIETEVFVSNNVISPDCSLIFVEDTLWVEGVVNGKVSIVAADVTAPNVDRSVWLPGSLTYAADDGSDGLMVLGEKDVLLSMKIGMPEDVVLRGIFVAQKGRFGRNHYKQNGGGNVPPAYGQYVILNSLTMIGTIISNGREGTQYHGNNQFVSGFLNRTNAYDRKLAADPPPFTPFTSSDYQFVNWKEE